MCDGYNNSLSIINTIEKMNCYKITSWAELIMISVQIVFTKWLYRLYKLKSDMLSYDTDQKY